jgi:hypothetical protein
MFDINIKKKEGDILDVSPFFICNIKYLLVYLYKIKVL